MERQCVRKEGSAGTLNPITMKFHYMHVITNVRVNYDHIEISSLIYYLLQFLYYAHITDMHVGFNACIDMCDGVWGFSQKGYSHT